MLVILGRAISVAVVGTLASLIVQKLTAKVIAINRQTWSQMNYHSELDDSFEDQMVIDLVPTGAERALIAEMCDVYEGTLWKEASLSGLLEQGKLEQVETMRLKWKFPKVVPTDYTESIE